MMWLLLAMALEVYPPKIELYGAEAKQTYLVFDQGEDVTAECAADNQATAKNAPSLLLRCRGKQLRVPVLVKPATRKPGVSFVNDVSPIFTMSGCAGANCHGSIRGQRGFKLSLFGNDPQLDFDAVHDAKAKRIDRAKPAQSLLLTKPTTEVAHGGGFRFAPDSLQYRTILNWIEAGAPFDDAGTPRVVKLEVYPAERLLGGAGAEQQLVAVARYSDGSVRDMTQLVQYSSNDPDTVAVSAKGRVKALQAGETAIMVRTMGQAVAARIYVAQGKPLRVERPVANYVDKHVFGKLERLGIPASPMSSDAEFLRRVSLDVTGLLPTVEETRAFLAAPDRKAWIEKLLARPEAAEVWALHFTELFRAGTREAGQKGAKIVYDYLRDAFLRNKPYDQMVEEVILSQGAHSFAQSSLAGVPRAPTSFYNISFDSNAPDHATNISQLFLGTRIECAKCHNHPWEKWTQDDFYGFAAFFARVGIKEVYENDENATQYLEEGSVEHPKTKKKVTPKFLDGGRVEDGPDKDIREDLVAWMRSPKNPFFAKAIVNRVWKRYFGRGLVEEVDDFRVTNPPSHPELLEELARDLVAHRFDLRHLMRTILNSSTYQLSGESVPGNAKDTRNLAHFPVRRLQAEVILDAMSQVSGTPEKFAGYPPETRAMQVYGGGGGYLLASFGKLSRDIICERDAQPDMAQTMHLISGDTVQRKLAKAKLPWELSDEALAEHVYLSALVRRPREAEAAALRARIAAAGRKTAFEDLLWALFNSKEFLYQH